MKPENADTSVESLLLDLHMGRLAPDEAARLRAQIAASPALARQDRAVGELCRLLDRCEAPVPPSDLADSVMAAVDRRTATLPLREPAPAEASGKARDLAAVPVLSLRELIAIAACITIFVGVFVPGYFKARSIAQRSLCQNNLRQIWAGMTAYTHDHDGYVAQAAFVPGGSWLRTTAPNVPRVSNTRPMYMLRRGDYVADARVFICPSDARHGRARPMLVDDYREFTDFAESANVSYSFQFMNVPKGRRLADMHPRMVIVGDRNPLFDGRAGHRLNPYNERAANSRAHGDGLGQCAVYVSGQGGWFTEPTVGVAGDNIYLAGQLFRYQGTETPVSDTDTMLVP